MVWSLTGTTRHTGGRTALVALVGCPTPPCVAFMYSR